MNDDHKFPKYDSCPASQYDERKAKLEKIGLIVEETHREGDTVHYRTMHKPEPTTPGPYKPSEGLQGAAQVMKGAGCIIILLILAAIILIPIFILTR